MPEHKKKSREESESDKKKQRHRRRESKSIGSNSESEPDQAKQRQPRPALEYRVTHIKEVTSVPQLLWTSISVNEAAKGKINMLYDSGSTSSLIKLKQLRDIALIYEDKIALTGITGHKVYTIVKMYDTIKLDGCRLKHAFYVVEDDTPIEHEGILGIDFFKETYRYVQLFIRKKSYVREFPGSLGFVRRLSSSRGADNAERGFDERDVDRWRSCLFVRVRVFREFLNGRDI